MSFVCSQGIPSVPTFYPTEAEFADPLRYIYSIRAEAERHKGEREKHEHRRNALAEADPTKGAQLLTDEGLKVNALEGIKPLMRGLQEHGVDGALAGRPQGALQVAGIPVQRLVHEEGSFAITFPNAYHAGFKTAAGVYRAEAASLYPQQTALRPLCGRQAVTLGKKQEPC
ncbi:hypothetical protein WJX73_007230 [Symbiochloris irregularis]|uniref:JmjN domain-containing protein n=1 Tax=Symbiochloris irregularis TaxID=706552 RepID=A0AAW1P353_9CHLO